MEQQSHTYRLTWHGITIRVVHTPRRWSAIENLEIRSIAPAGAPLPITATGYRSHFIPIGTVDVHGGDVVAQLDEEATKPDWRAHIEASRQGELF
ncbi:hypothetical protein WG908_13810 [Sphingobium sp. AN641]|uniref:hypothetical protein n=1 Tax=Sphingobium sp. AN641 TaxID=3133443 RepID=UPI0030BEB4EA